MQEKTPITDTAGSPLEVFLAFLKLGLTSFGGPIAHLGYFRDELVKRRQWVGEQGYADLVALCQFLPGPASSQVGFALGMVRAGFGGALMAWVAFTLPSALILLVFAYSADALGGALGQSAIHGLKLVAVTIVAHAVWGMARNLCPDRPRAMIAVGALAAVVLIPSAIGQLAAIVLGALAGLIWCQNVKRSATGHINLPLSRHTGVACLLTFFLLLGGLPIAVAVWPAHFINLFEAFYRAGALVFGGGHIVLPLLEASVVDAGWVSADAFLSGYGAAQAIPGPLFTFAAYLGAVDANLGGLPGAVVALLGIFLPGMLILLGVLPFWDEVRQQRFAYPLMAGANAAVVGILAAALYQPVWISAVLEPEHFLIVVAGFVLLATWKLSPWIVVVGTVVASMFLSTAL
ncbi:chromate efflux transporter [Vibrio parahaemolyticus]|nr:chromate efflux transporter [Vibrio parahaemolyticus]